MCVCKDVRKCVDIRDGPIKLCFQGGGQKKSGHARTGKYSWQSGWVAAAWPASWSSAGMDSRPICMLAYWPAVAGWVPKPLTPLELNLNPN